MNKWNHAGKWRLPTRNLASGRKQLAITAPVELSKLLERCSLAGADAARVAEVAQLLNPLLGTTGKQKRSAGNTSASRVTKSGPARHLGRGRRNPTPRERAASARCCAGRRGHR